MGGAFTNQIVDTPTLFKFAKGTGLMGEAGPEAIMPLKRDGSGNLGVRAQPNNVNVVVNNHSGQPAKTNETIDSRGNRTIEVIVGDVVAQQIATKGSLVQQSMSSTYGSRPALARR
jgi:phage-related minor tail protein